MKILFVDPPRGFVKNVRTSRVKEPDLGIGYISAQLKRKGHETGVIDAFAESLSFDDIEQRIRTFSPDMLGMPLFTFKVYEAAEIARRAKKLNPEIKVVTGGAHATALPKRTLEEFPGFDFCVMGEGEEPVAEIIDSIEGGRTYGNIKGLAWRRDGEIVRNGPRAAIKNLDLLAFPDWGAFPLDRYFPIYSTRSDFLELPISAARGCAGRCSFCFRLTRGYIRSRTAKNVIAELERNISEFGMKSAIFMDEAFTAEPGRTHELCAEMMKSKIQQKIHWLCETRVDRVDPELLKHMKEAGCAHVSYGVESGSADILTKNGKGTTPEQAFDAVKWTKDAGLQVDTYFVFGLPYESRETMLETRRFALRANPDFANFFILVPYPGTLAMKLAREGKANLKLLTEDWSQYGIQIGGAMELNDMPREDIERFQFISYLMFYLRPSRWRSLLRMVSFKSVPIYIYHLISGLLKGKEPGNK